MTRPTYNRVCQCCGTAFIAGHPAAKWCGSNCTMRAYQRRRRGAPEADSGLSLVVQPTVIEDPEELPLAWRVAEAPAAHEARHWAGTAITRRSNDGFIHATAMCKAGGREWFTYARSERTQAYIAALAAVPQFCGTDLVQSIQGGTPDLQGTWIHPRLAVDPARWISPQFAVWMDGWFLESISKPQQLQQRLPLTPGVHVVANSPRQANWLWGLAVERHVSSALMTQIAADNSRRPEPTYQLHLLP